MPNILEVLQANDMLMVAAKVVLKSSQVSASVKKRALKDSVARSAA